MTWTTDSLIARARRKLRIPDGDAALSDQELMDIGDEVTRISILGMMRRTNAEWYVSEYTVDVVANTGSYRLPERIQAGGVRDVTLVDVNGHEFDLPEFRLEHAYTPGWAQGTMVRGYVIQDNSVVLRPTPTTATYQLRIRYRRQPAELVLTTNSQVAAITSTSATTVTVASIPGALIGTTPADIVQANPPFDLLGGPATTGFGDFSVNTYTPDDSQVAVDAQNGDYICKPGRTPIPQVPPVCHDLLLYGIAATGAQELGMPDANQFKADYLRLEEDVFEQLSDRNEGSTQKIFSRNSHLRGRKGRSWGWLR